MKKQDSPLYIRLPPDLLVRIERLRGNQTVRPSLTETIRVLIEQGLEVVEDGRRKDTRRRASQRS